jgi:anaerobic ribonucleoside-triphosphate reductase activating protein
MNKETKEYQDKNGLHIQSITTFDVNNGLGFRTTVWVSGCKHHCPECQNEWLQNYKLGKPLSEVKDKIFEVLADVNIDGITFSGGDPLDQNNIAWEQLESLLKEIKEKYPNKDIWVYTGNYFEDMINHAFMGSIFNYIDVLVDGLYENDKRDITLPYRGSSNQRIVDVQASIKTKKTITISDETFKK